jgi:hypothetical protein
MALCPTCEYELGTLPGVPAAPGAEFAAAARCPECGHDFPRGARLLVGSTPGSVAALQPATRRARYSAMLVPMAPALLFAVNGVQAVLALCGVGRSRGALSDILWAGALVPAALIVWATLGRWSTERSRRKAGDGPGRAMAAREIVWQAEPGRLTVFLRSSADRAPTRRDHATAGLRRVAAHPAPKVRIRAGETARNVVQLEACFVEPGREGRAARIEHASIHVDAGGEPAGGAITPEAAARAAGQRLAETVEATLRDGPPAAGPLAPLTVAAADATVTGSPRPAESLAARHIRALQLGMGSALVIFLLGMPIVAVAAGSGSRGSFGYLLPLAICGGLLLHWSLRRSADRRAAAVATWTAVAGELRVDTADLRKPAASRRSSALRLPRLHGIVATERKGRAMLVARSGSGRTLAALDANVSPEAADGLARRLTAVIRGDRTPAP